MNLIYEKLKKIIAEFIFAKFSKENVKLYLTKACEKLKEKADSTENKYDDFAVKCFECIVNNDETLGMLVDYIVNGIYELDVDGKVICKANSNIREISEVVAGELSCCKFDANGNHICNSISWIEVARILEMLATLLSAWKTIETK